jgi:hypothetical protein
MRIKIFDSDVSHLYPLIETWAKESNARDFGMTIDPERLLGHAEFLRDCPDTELLALGSKEGRVLGVMGLVISPNIVENGSILNEHIWYVLPQHRSRASLGLINEAQRWGAERGCGHFVITASKMISDLHDTMCHLYNRLGFKKFETTYIREI